MSNAQDGLVFVDIKFKNGASESFNVSAISRVRELDQETCESLDLTHPTVVISITGVQQDIRISGYSIKEFKKDIQDAINSHYDAIAEKFLLGKGES